MAWNPDKYNAFKAERYKPYSDLVSHIQDKPNLIVLDLGCGTGELTKMLADSLTHPTVLGIDSSAEMLAKTPVQANLTFKQTTIEEQVADTAKWDLIFTNAALQWVDDHNTLLPAIISKLNPQGQLAIQMPSQTENVLNMLLLELVRKEPFASSLNLWYRAPPVLSLDEYTSLLFQNGASNMIIYQKVYPLIAQSPDELFEFIAGTTLVPYFERLNNTLQEELSIAFKNKIRMQFPKTPLVYAFKRIIIYATFSKEQ